MQASQAYITEAATHIQQALWQMPVRSPTPWPRVADKHPLIPETTRAIECYVYDLLTREEREACNLATD